MANGFEQNIPGEESIAVLNGAPNEENAMKLIAYYLRPEVQVRLFDLVGNIPVSKKASTALSPEMQKWQPDPENSNDLMIDDKYWADNLEAINRRFKEWLLT
ncbi:hypothetical protein MA20_47100 [Bradyrhizobium japonicum]|uniref:ABC transporter substrate-binding protein n=1 Tax=Bradyrhizobium japonicum TaxID=375 RepID=A0A0A3XF09_BRAJP|nr:hypothetical protein MA20_47100 [Bradyrhizobium japonicum]